MLEPFLTSYTGQMDMPQTAKVAAETLQQISNLPASMNDNPFLYWSTLTAMMGGAALGIAVSIIMGMHLVRDRRHAGFKSVLFNFRLMMLLCGFGTFASCLPEVLYLQIFGDTSVSVTTQAVVMNAKRYVDSARVYIIMGWVGILGMIYPYICLALIESYVIGSKESFKHAQVPDYPALRRLLKPVLGFIILGAVAGVFTLTKVYKQQFLG